MLLISGPLEKEPMVESRVALGIKRIPRLTDGLVKYDDLVGIEGVVAMYVVVTDTCY